MGKETVGKETLLSPACPRCGATVGGDYRFCPACAYRLRAPDDAPDVAVPRAPPWKTAFLVAGGAVVALAAVLVGVLIFHPALLESARPSRPGPPSPEGAALASPVIRVDDIPASLVDLPEWKAAQVYDVDSFTNLSEDARARLAAAAGAQRTVVSRIHYPMRIMKAEVTRGQYDEFLRDVQAGRHPMPRVWVTDESKPVDLFEHVPESWVVKDAAGDPRDWRLEDVDRNLPVTEVSYYDAYAFGEWVSKRLGVNLRLPVQMEWVRAARAGRLEEEETDRPWDWPWGGEPLIYACNNAGSWPGLGRVQYVQSLYSEPVGGDGGATPEGALALAGNVAEWATEVEVVPVIPELGGEPYVSWKPPDDGQIVTALAMGGSFRDGIADCRVESLRRHPADKNGRRDDVGFRLVSVPE